VDTTRALPLFPRLPTRTANFLGEFEVVVREADRDVFTGIELQDNDEFALSATGEIRAFRAAGPSGPDGWAPDQLVDDARWPLHTGLNPAARKFALLGSLGGYFMVGADFPRTRFLHPEPLPLYLRINDDVPGDGSGEFRVRIRLWGKARPIPGMDVSCVIREPDKKGIAGIGGVHADGSSWRLSLDAAIDLVDRGCVFRVGEARVAISRRKGRLYLRTVSNRKRTDNLETLPLCPETP